MKNLVAIIILALLGAAGAYGYLKWSEARKPSPTTSNENHAADDGHGHAASDGHSHGAEGAVALHADAAASAGAALCATHRIPESIDAFCHAELVAQLGHCGAHDVPEAFCTRCSPTLIPAFKAENDWCEQESLPKSQCAHCKNG